MEEDGYTYLNDRAQQLLAESRGTFRRAGLRETDTAITFSGVEWFPWNGSRVLLTLELCAKAAGINTERDSLCLRYQKLTATEFGAHRAEIAAARFTAADLIPLVRDLERDRFDEHVTEPLLQKAFIAEVLDLSGARTAARAIQGNQSRDERHG
jgi:hypothetical protein